jgi:uncharacterized phage protein (TIGR02220 family)
MNTYDLNKEWFAYVSQHTNVKANHSHLYFFILNKWNMLFWKKEFGLPTEHTMQCLNILSYKTYIKTLLDLNDFGFIKIVERSKNQNTSNIIEVVNNTKAMSKATTKANTKALLKATTQSEYQSDVQSDVQSDDSIIKPINSITDKQTNKQTNSGSKEPLVDVIDFKKLLIFFNQTTGRKFKSINTKAQRQFNARLKEGYTKEDIMKAIVNCFNDDFHIQSNHKFLTPEFISRADKIDRFSQQNQYKKTNLLNKPAEQGKTGYHFQG